MCSSSVQRFTIRKLEEDISNVMLVALVIGKQEPFNLRVEDDAASRAVWNLTVRDTARDYINCAYWGTVENVTTLNAVVQIGCLIEIINPRVILRVATDKGEEYRPVVTSPFYLIVSENYGSINKVREYNLSSLTSLIHLPTKPLYNHTTLDFVFSNISSSSELVLDLLVAVRHVAEMRVVQTRNGLKQVCNVIVFDKTNQGMSLTFWNSEYIARASLWQPRNTILFITDCKIKYDNFSKTPKGCPSSKSIITEDPEGNEAFSLREYALTAPLPSITSIDYFNDRIPDISSINTVMTIEQIALKINQISEQKSARVEDQQFATILYATITEFDIDGQRRIFIIRCYSCKSPCLENERCKNPTCLTNTTELLMENEKVFDILLQVSDKTGTLMKCRFGGKQVENVIGYNPKSFSELSDDEKANIKWKFLMEICEIKLNICLNRKRPFLRVLTLAKANPNSY